MKCLQHLNARFNAALFAQQFLAARRGCGAGKTVLITGASSGLGYEMARQFAALGYHLALCARRVDHLEQLKAQLLSDHSAIKVSVKSLDVTDYAQVFSVFHEFASEFGSIERVIVNAGIGDGRRLGKGNFAINQKTAEVNFISALAQFEAAMTLFRAQNNGHLVVISSISAYRGLPKHLSTYAASKAAIAHLAEGVRADMLKSKLPICISTIYPGYIRTEINAGAAKLPFEVDQQTGGIALAAAIEARANNASVPALPWALLKPFMQLLPLGMVNALTK